MIHQPLGGFQGQASDIDIHAREVLNETREVFGDKVFEVVVHKSIRFAEASVASQAMAEYAGSHKGALAYRELAQELVARG